MDTQQAKKLFKTWFKDKQYGQCKQLLLNMIANGNDDYKLLSKLGDICVEIGEYQNAEKYYIRSINKHKNSASLYVKYGNLLHQHLNNNIKAQIMYNCSMKIDSNNDACWFNYGKLLYKMGKYEESERCYNACVAQKACIYYHYALLLLSYKPSDTLKIKSLLHKATQIQPNVAQYHYKYAQCLANMHLINEANHEYHKAAVLSHYGDVLLLFDFAKFSYEQLRNYDAAKRLLQTALNLDHAKQYECVHSYYQQMIRNQEEHKNQPIIENVPEPKHFEHAYSENNDGEGNDYPQRRNNEEPPGHQRHSYCQQMNRNQEEHENQPIIENVPEPKQFEHAYSESNDGEDNHYPQRRNKEEQRGSYYHCGVCTYLNPPDLSQCEMCGHEYNFKPHQPQQRREQKQRNVKKKNFDNQYNVNNDRKQTAHRTVTRKGVVCRWKVKPKPNGLKILDNLPVRLINKEDAEKKMDCRICMERFQVGDKVKTLPCFHWQFHGVCIAHWLKDNQCCPICLHAVTKLE